MCRCLLVDDDRWALADIRRSFPFAQLGVEIVGEYTTISDAYEAVERERPDILITDICMGTENGLDLMAYHRERQRDAIDIIISGHDDFSFAQRAVNLGAFYYMLKPIDRQEAVKTLTRAVEQIQDLHHRTAMTVPENVGSKDIFTQVRVYLENHYMESITLEMLAEKFFLNPSYLSALFSRRINKNFSQYKNELRICRAKALLDNNCTVEEAAERTGYVNSSYFTRVFKQVTGITPKEYKDERR